MNAVAVGISVGSFVAVMGTVVGYLRTIPRNKVPIKVTGLVVKLWIGIGLAVAAVAWSIHATGTVGAAVIVPAVLATLFAFFVLYVAGQRRVPKGDLQVSVGGKLLPFGANTSDGAAFHSDQLAGKRTLLKFFRGGW